MEKTQIHESELNNLCGQFVAWFFDSQRGVVKKLPLETQDMIAKNLVIGFYNGYRKAEENSVNAQTTTEK